MDSGRSGYAWRAASFLQIKSNRGNRQLSSQSPTKGLRSLPGQFAANVDVAHGGADIAVKEFLDFPRILSPRCGAVAEDRFSTGWSQ
jgi:hypothetical protein